MTVNLDIGEGWEYEKGFRSPTLAYNVWLGPEPQGFDIFTPHLQLGVKVTREGVMAYAGIGNDLIIKESFVHQSASQVVKELNEALHKDKKPQVIASIAIENIESDRAVFIKEEEDGAWEKISKQVIIV